VRLAGGGVKRRGGRSPGLGGRLEGSRFLEPLRVGSSGAAEDLRQVGGRPRWAGQGAAEVAEEIVGRFRRHRGGQALRGCALGDLRPSDLPANGVANRAQPLRLGEGLGSGDLERAPPEVVGQRVSDDRGDVVLGDRGHGGVRVGQLDRPAAADRGCPGEVVGHEHRGTDKGPGDPRGFDGFLDLAVCPANGVRLGVGHGGGGEQDDALDAGGAGQPNEPVAATEYGEEEDGSGQFKGGAQRLWATDIGPVPGHAPLAQRWRRVPRRGVDALALPRQCVDDVAADSAGGSGDEDHDSPFCAPRRRRSRLRSGNSAAPSRSVALPTMAAAP